MAAQHYRANEAARPTFLPLTVAATRRAASSASSADLVRQRAEQAEVLAVACWSALLGGCHSADRRALPTSLRALVEATSSYVGTAWWRGSGATHRRRVTEARLRINDALRDGDGAEFAEAFVGYDQAVATCLASADVCEPARPGQNLR